MKRFIPRTMFGAVFASAVLMTASPASAQVTFSGGGGGNPDENVLFQGATTGTNIFGVTNNTGAQVRFDTNGTGQVISGANSSGQARITPVGTSTFSALNISLADATFDAFNDLKFGVDAATDGFIMLTAFGSFGQQSTTLALGGNGSNVFRVQATGTNTLTRVLLQSVNPTANFVDVAQVRIGGVVDNVGTAELTPEPGALELSAGGLLPLAGLLWTGRKRSKGK